MEYILTWLRGFHGNTLLSNLRVLPYVNAYVDTSHQYIATFHCPCTGCTWPFQLFHGFQRQCSKDTKFCVDRFPELLPWIIKNWVLVLNTILGGCSVFIVLLKPLCWLELYSGVELSVQWVEYRQTHALRPSNCWDRAAFPEKGVVGVGIQR